MKAIALILLLTVVSCGVSKKKLSKDGMKVKILDRKGSNCSTVIVRLICVTGDFECADYTGLLMCVVVLVFRQAM